jgi:hypothetical protein
MRENKWHLTQEKIRKPIPIRKKERKTCCERAKTTKIA